MFFPFPWPKNFFLYVLLAAILLATCVFSSLLAFKMKNRGPDVVWTKTELAAHNSAITLDLPFTAAEDPSFTIDPEIRFYVRSTKAFFGHNDDFMLYVYSVTFRTEILQSDWSPNIENMSDVTISTLKKNELLSNLAYQKRYVTIGKTKAMEVASRYKLRGENYMQRVLHLAFQGSIWSLKATFREKDGLSDEMITKIFRSISVTANAQKAG
ncbi:MAG: hypothetical protein LBO03_08445 [Acidaminococcales bacterium]|jgi:hypothetical protein|nr:hypothetical protein [Acidaminococcales bacterium]